MKKTYTIYTAYFKDGHTITATSNEYSNRLRFYNHICLNSLGKGHGELLRIDCRAMHI